MTDHAGAVSAPRSTVRSPLARWLAATCAILMCLGFCALGTWQFIRLQWKLDLIARVEQRVHARAMAAPAPPAWASVSKAADEYRHVFLQGHYLVGADALVQATTELGGGFWLMTPFCTSDGAIVLVNRGFVTPARPRPIVEGSASCTPGAAPLDTVTGLLRLPEPGGGYLRNNDPAAERWYSRDVAAIAAARKLGAVAPYFVDREADASAPGADAPVGGLTVLNFTNNHLVYALTWCALALLAAGGVYVLLRRGAPRQAP